MKITEFLQTETHTCITYETKTISYRVVVPLDLKWLKINHHIPKEKSILVPMQRTHTETVDVGFNKEIASIAWCIHDDIKKEIFREVFNTLCMYWHIIAQGVAFKVLSKNINMTVINYWQHSINLEGVKALVNCIEQSDIQTEEKVYEEKVELDETEESREIDERTEIISIGTIEDDFIEDDEGKFKVGEVVEE